MASRPAPPIHPDPTTMPDIRMPDPDDDPTYQSLKNWGSVKEVSNAGISIVYGGADPGRDPKAGKEIGIGIWKRNSPNHRSWDGLLEMPVNIIVTRWVLRGVDFGLRVPYMGMPPREPTDQLMWEAVSSEVKPFSDWFKYANVVPAKVFAEYTKIDPKTATIELRGSMREYNFSTAEPEVMRNIGFSTVNYEDKSIDNLYYIQLLHNELPSYHFWSDISPIGPDGKLRHSLFERGPNACYEILGLDLVIDVVPNTSTQASPPPTGNTAPKRSKPARGKQTHSQPYSQGNPSSRKPNPKARHGKAGKDLSHRISFNRDTGTKDVKRKARKDRRQTASGEKHYRPQPGEGSEPQEVILNKRKRKPSAGGETFKPLSGEGEEPQEVRLNKRKRASESEKAYVPGLPEGEKDL